MPRKSQRDTFLSLIRSRALTVGMFVVAGAICIALGREVARRVAVQREIDRLTRQIADAQQTTNDLDRLLATLKSSTYEEGAARAYMNLQKPGEKVLVVPDVTEDTVTNSTVEQQSDGSTSTPQTSHETNSKKWWNFLFHTT